MKHEHIVRAERKHEVAETIDLTQLALTRAPNYLHKDGRIYTSRVGQPYVAVAVSPYNAKFESQIERGIYREVNALLERGYLTLSSCEGHSISFSFPYVMVAFGDNEKAVQFADHFRTLRWASVTLQTSVANVHQNGRSFERLDEQLHNVRDEYADLNRMFHRAYDQYWFVTVALFETRRGIRNVVRNWKMERQRSQFLCEGLDGLYESISRLPIHIG